MQIRATLFGMALLCLFQQVSYGQVVDSAADKVAHFPSRLFARLQSKTSSLDRQLTTQTTIMLRRMQRQEDRMRRKMAGLDSIGAASLFLHSSQQYEDLIRKIQTDSGKGRIPLQGTYMPYVDSLQGVLTFLQKNPQLVNSVNAKKLQDAVSQFQSLQVKVQDADQVKAFVQQRKQDISRYLAQHANLHGSFGKDYAELNQNVYYYSQQVRQYKEMWNDPSQMERKVLQLLNKLPAFQSFMKNNSQLAGLFGLPTNYGSPESLIGLQTRSQVAQQIQGQVAAAGPGGPAALQSNLQSAQSQLDGYKEKLNKLGQGNGDIDMPDFKPNDQKTKSFLHRLELGTNFQTTHNNYYFPTVTDLGISLGYKLGHSNIVGIGASYKIGWGNGLQHLALSSQGAGLRSFLEIKIKGTFSATGGLEYNYTTPFSSFQDIKNIQRWTHSGLIGISKTISMKSQLFKKTKLQLLWDFLSYQQVPRTQPLLFRVGYNF